MEKKKRPQPQPRKELPTDENIDVEEEEERIENPQLNAKRIWLLSLTQEDRDYIAIYGEEMWRRKKKLEK